MEIDDDNEEIPPIDLLPQPITICAHLKPFVDSTKTVHADSILILSCDHVYLKEGDKLFDIKYMVRGPHRPSQLVREQHAMHCYGLASALDPLQCWEAHFNDPVKQAFRTCVILRSAAVDYDFDTS